MHRNGKILRLLSQPTPNQFKPNVTAFVELVAPVLLALEFLENLQEAIRGVNQGRRSFSGKITRRAA